MMVSVGEFKYVAEGFLVPAISLFGLLGNLLTVIVLRDHREVGQSGGSTVAFRIFPLFGFVHSASADVIHFRLM